MKYLLEAVTILAIGITSGSFLLYDAPEPEWKHEIVDNDTYGKFVEIDSYGDSIGIAYVESIDTGIRLAEKTYSDSITDILFRDDREWSFQVIDDTAETGMYPSLESRKGEPFISYQDGDLGDEKLYYASRSDSSWNREEVDNVAEGGVSVGMYPSLAFQEGRPVIFYHSPSQGLKMAEKQGEEWQKQQLENDQGWYTETSKCEGKIIAAYRGRDSSRLKIGEKDQGWNSENTSINMKSDLDIDTKYCENHIIYLDEETEQITYKGPEETKKFGQKFFTRVSLEAEENIHLTYYDEGSGIVYAEKKKNGWNDNLVRESPEAGKYNDLTISENGNIHLVYTDEETVYHSFYNEGTAEKIEKHTEDARKGLTAITFILLITTAIRRNLLQKVINKI